MREAVRLGSNSGGTLRRRALHTGIIASRKAREETSEHVERDVAVSYLNRFAVLQVSAPDSGSTPGRCPRPACSSWDPRYGILGDPDDLNSEKSYQPMVAHAARLRERDPRTRRQGPVPRSAFFGLGPASSARKSDELSGRWQRHSQTGRDGGRVMAQSPRPTPRRSCRSLRPGTRREDRSLFGSKNRRGILRGGNHRSCRRKTSTTPTSIASCRPPKPSCDAPSN